jgi:hypothetical protein
MDDVNMAHNSIVQQLAVCSTLLLQGLQYNPVSLLLVMHAWMRTIFA